ncbi:MAG: hypothetical protein H6Q89_3131 [Myxococcaceae bacterium]|nr:hypothetical protein [Myxococcaceae bacterium]
MRLERHVGGLSIARKEKYLLGAGWRSGEGGWSSPEPDTEPLAINKAVHHQLTRDLSTALASSGWKVVGYSPRGYARMQDPADESLCSLPAALRRQARREGRPVGQLTYSLFLAALLKGAGE